MEDDYYSSCPSHPKVVCRGSLAECPKCIIDDIESGELQKVKEKAQKVAFCDKIDFWIKDEQDAYDEYSKYGFDDVAMQEKGHRDKFTKIKKSLGC